MGSTSQESGSAGSAAKPDRNLALELVRVTEAAALAAARWVGRGDKIAADQAAVDAMRLVLDTVYMEKLAGNAEIADLLDLDRPIAGTLGLIAERKGIDVGDVMVVVLDRPRH